MNDITEFEGNGQIVEAADASMAIGLTRAEIDQQIATARAYPRSLKRVQSAILSMATLDEESAEECMYALPRGGKPIQGPSIRFAEILKQSYGNCRAAARVVNVDRKEKFIEAEGVFHDLETNTATMARVRRRISNKQGALLTDDMIIVTGNAACSIALRNAILGGVPKPLWRRAYESVQSTIAGDATTLSASRSKAIAFFANFGVKPEQIFQAIGVTGEEDITVDHVVTLRAMGATVKNGEATVEEMFNPSQTQPDQKPSIQSRLEAASKDAGQQEGFKREQVVDDAKTLSAADAKVVESVDAQTGEITQAEPEMQSGEPASGEDTQAEPFDANEFLNQVETWLGNSPAEDDVEAAWSNLDVEAALAHFPEELGIAQGLKRDRLEAIKKGK